MMETFIELVARLQGHSWAPIVFVVSYAAACLALPITLFPVAGGFLFGFWGGVICNMTAALLGASAAFWLGGRIRRNVLLKWLKRKMPEENPHIARYGFTGLFLARLVGFPPFLVTNYLSGTSGMKWGTYLSATFWGILPWTLLLTYLAGTFWEILLSAGVSGFQAAVAQRTRPLIITALFLAGFVIVGWILRKKLFLQ